MQEIWFCKTKDKHGHMSNFFQRRMIDARSKLVMSSSEAVYQSRKFKSRKIIEEIANALNAFVSKKVAYKYPLQNPLWDQGENLTQMKSVILSKYQQHPDIAKELIDTFPAKIYELSYKDQFWGTTPDKTGLNHLGKILEEVRSILMNTNAKYTQADYNSLRDAIKAHDFAYYVQDNPIIEDDEYNSLYERLKTMERENPSWVTPDSPTQRAGSSLCEKRPGQFDLVAHLAPMVSLKTEIRTTSEPIAEFVDRMLKCVELPRFTIEYKYDGMALDLIYRKTGENEATLMYALTRGDGVMGEDISMSAKRLSSIPLVISSSDKTDMPDIFSVRGEVVLLKSAFAKINSQLVQRGMEPYKNCRNAAAGMMRTLQADKFDPWGLVFYPYDFINANSGSFIEPWAFTTGVRPCFNFDLFGFPMAHDRQKCIDYLYDKYQSIEAGRSMLDFDIDGVVFKLDDCQRAGVPPTNSREPAWAIAHKFEPQKATTVVLDIDVQVGRTGRITPVARLEPVFVAGTMVSNVTLHNAGEIAKLGLSVGDTVFVHRGGDVIPVISGIAVKKQGVPAFTMPSLCPDCTTELVQQNDQHLCPNAKCPSRTQMKFEHFVSRKAMNIEDVGEALIASLIEKGLLNTFADFYSLGKKDDESLSISQAQVRAVETLMKEVGCGEKTAVKVARAIEASKRTTLVRFLFALGIRYVGYGTAQRLARRYGNLDDIMIASAAELEAIEDIGYVTAASIADYFNNQENVQVVNDLRLCGVTWGEQSSQFIVLPLSGLTLAITGGFQASREAMQLALESFGAQVTSSASSKTSAVFVGEGASPSKIAAAEKYSIAKLNWQDFTSMATDAAAWRLEFDKRQAK